MHHKDGFLSYECRKQCLHKLVFAFFWILGIVLGFCYASAATDFTSSLMLSVVDGRLSIIGLLLVLIFPLFISFVIFRFSKPLLLLPILFFKAFSFGCCIFSIAFTFGDAGWLVRWILAFSDSCAVVVLVWFCLKNAAGNKETLKTDFMISLLSSAAIGCIDYLCISPFALMLFDHL